MKIKLETKNGIEEFDGDLTMLTYDIYFSTFGNDMLVDATRSLQVIGAYSRAYLLRVIYAMIKTKDSSFMDFIPFLETLEDDIVSFFENIDDELLDMITAKVTSRVDKEVNSYDKVTN